MNSLVKIISTEIDSMKRRIVKVLRNGKSDVQTSFEASAYGVDSNCPKGFIAVYAPTSEKGKTVIIGYINKNAKAAIGELRLFSTDDSGEEQFYVWLKNDGFLELGGTTNYAVKFNELKTEFNKLKQDHNTLVQTFNTHTQAVITTPGGLVASAPTVTASPNTSNIDNAKNDKIKTIG